MSGTSLDGVDLALCEFNFKGKFRTFEIAEATTLPYNSTLSKKLKECINYDDKELALLDIEVGEFFSEVINSFLAGRENLPQLIASHGHTVFHRPEEGLTLQIGNGEVMAEKTGITVVNDFRSQDVLLGGQGAPLVPVGDRDLFYAYDFCLNLGGFANISYNDSDSSERIACDISACNMAFNHLSQKLGQPYDSNGLLARGGDIDSELLDQLNNLNYYKLPAPKSLGKEWFVDQFLPILESSELNIFDKLATTTEHIAMQIAKFINVARQAESKLLITGGGAYNSFLIERIRNTCDISMILPRNEIIEYKEALIFAYLGILRIRNEVNVLSSVTGAREDSSSGVIHCKN